MKKLLLIIGLSLVSVSTLSAQEAQENSEVQVLRQQVQVLYQQMSRIIQELNYLSSFVDKNVALNVVIPTKDLASKGDADAPVTLIEFSDYQCPYCSVYALQSAPAIDSLYVDTGKARKVFFDFPIPSLHPFANAAAEAARCAGEQNKYWEMHDALFADQRGFAELTPYAEAAGLDVEAFTSCIEDDRYDVAIEASMTEADSYGIRSTPTIAIGYTQPDGSVKIERFMRGGNNNYGATIQLLIDRLN